MAHSVYFFPGNHVFFQYNPGFFRAKRGMVNPARGFILGLPGYIVQYSRELNYFHVRPFLSSYMKRELQHPLSMLKIMRAPAFFQDRFGPGHMIPDTAAARAYLRQELADADSMRGPYYEQAGFEGNYLRVNLSVLRQDLVPFEVFAEAFCESVNAIQPPSIETWRREWETILETIRSMNLSLPHFEEDIHMIEQLLLEKNYVVHHSDTFVDAYDPHYRIISREIFEKKILPFLKP